MDNKELKAYNYGGSILSMNFSILLGLILIINGIFNGFNDLALIIIFFIELPLIAMSIYCYIKYKDFANSEQEVKE